MHKKLSLVGTVLVIGMVLLLGIYALQGGLGSNVLAQRGSSETVTTSSNPVDVSRTILVVGRGTVTIEPDEAQAIIGVETVGDNVREATQESSEIMEAVLSALLEEGVAERDIQTSGFSVWTDRDGQLFGIEVEQERVRYRVNNTVRVTVRELDDLSVILDAAIDAGANAIHGINFSIGDSSRLETQARLRAVADAKAKAEELADLTGVSIGPVVSVSEVIGTGGIGVMREMDLGMGGGAGPISPAEMDYTVQLQVTYAIQ